MITAWLKKCWRIPKNKYTYSADGEKFNFNSIKNLNIIASNSKTTKVELKNFLKKNFGTQMQDMNKTNARDQNRKKDFMLGVYRNISTLFGLLFKSND